MSTKDTLDKAYGNIPKEPMITLDVSWVPSYRGLRYYWIKFIRSMRKVK